jgi:hypothetical protein
MRRLLVPVALVLAVPSTSRGEVGLGLGLRAGYGEPRGDYLESYEYSAHFQLDAMFRTSFRTAVGLYAGYALDVPSSATKASCDSHGSTCHASTFRAGIQFTGDLLDLGVLGLWGGIGSGYVASTSRYDFGRATLQDQVRGWEWATISAGADLKPLKPFGAGLYVSWGIGQFNVREMKWNSLHSGVDYLTYGIGSEKAVFHVYQIGLRGLFNL